MNIVFTFIILYFVIYHACQLGFYNKKQTAVSFFQEKRMSNNIFSLTLHTEIRLDCINKILNKQQLKCNIQFFSR